MLGHLVQECGLGNIFINKCQKIYHKGIIQREPWVTYKFIWNNVNMENWIYSLIFPLKLRPHPWYDIVIIIHSHASVGKVARSDSFWSGLIWFDSVLNLSGLTVSKLSQITSFSNFRNVHIFETVNKKVRNSLFMWLVYIHI